MRNGQPHGFGILRHEGLFTACVFLLLLLLLFDRSPGGNCYFGEFAEGKKHGFGEFRWKNGNAYVGTLGVQLLFAV